MKELFGINIPRQGRFRFIVDIKNNKFQMFKRTSREFILITTWTLERLVEEMIANDD